MPISRQMLTKKEKSAAPTQQYIHYIERRDYDTVPRNIQRPSKERQHADFLGSRHMSKIISHVTADTKADSFSLAIGQALQETGFW